VPVTLSPAPWQQFLDANGNPYAAAKLFTYAAGTTTKLATYQDSAGTIAHSNPITLDSAGRVSLYLQAAAYKFVLAPSTDTDPPSSPYRTQDNISAVPFTTVDLDVAATAGETLTAGEAVYLSPSDGRWYRTDADVAGASSSAGFVGMVPEDIATGASGTVRLQGRITGLAGLTIGANYYVSATAGAITATAPANTRFLGVADSLTSLIIAPNPAPATIDRSLCQGRLTLTSGTPVTTSDVTAATTLYWAPFKGGQAALYTGSAWVLTAPGQLSIAVPATTNQLYDVFLDYNAGTPTLALVAWTNDTTRATALTTQDHVYVLTGNTARRYLGSFRTTGVSGQTEDSVTKRYVWNYHHRVERPMRVFDGTDTWTYTLATYRQANGNAANQLDFVIGVNEDAVQATVHATVSNNTGGVDLALGIGLDATNALAAAAVTGYAQSNVNVRLVLVAHFTDLCGIGRHTLTWLEYSTATGTSTWVGDAGSPAVRSGMVGSLKG